MKKLSLTAIILFSIQFSFSQIKLATNWEEFNYVNKELAVDRKTDKIKMGYQLVPFSEEYSVKWPNGFTRFTKLYTLNKGDEIRAVIIKCTDNKGGLSFHCIPTSDADPTMWMQAYTDFESIGSDWYLTIAWGMTKIISSNMDAKR